MYKARLISIHKGIERINIKPRKKKQGSKGKVEKGNVFKNKTNKRYPTNFC
jgi:hypothetical protein